MRVSNTEVENVTIVGGGSGHGFKHGPAVGELIAEALTGNRKIPGLFRCGGLGNEC